MFYSYSAWRYDITVIQVFQGVWTTLRIHRRDLSGDPQTNPTDFITYADLTPKKFRHKPPGFLNFRRILYGFLLARSYFFQIPVGIFFTRTKNGFYTDFYSPAVFFKNPISV